jgi:signal transduction histidine kinase
MNEKRKKKFGFIATLVFCVVIGMLAAYLANIIVGVFLYNIGDPEIVAIIDAPQEQFSRFELISMAVTVVVTSVVTALLVLFYFKISIVKPIHNIISATRAVADGNFYTYVKPEGVYEAEELARNFNNMTKELALLETRGGDFANNVAHELKVPIGSVRGFVEILREGNLTEAEKKVYLDIIAAELRRLSVLSINVLTLSKYEHMEIITNKKPFSLDEQIRKAIIITQSDWEAKQITLDAEDMEAVTFVGNEDYTQQIWLNLVDNAIKFSHPGGTIKLSLFKKGDGVLFSIKDDGMGMSERTKERVFEKLFQGDTSRASAGSGLGLPIARRIARLCGGDIKVEKSELGKGSTFSVFLPM